MYIVECPRAKINFGGKLGNPPFCHIVGMERPTKILIEGRYRLYIGFEIGLNEKLSMCKETEENVFSDKQTHFATYRHPIMLL